MSIRQRLNAGFITINIIFIVVLGYLTVQFSQIGQQVNTTVDVHFEEIELLNTLQKELLSQRVYLQMYIIDPSTQNLERITAHNDSTNSIIQSLNMNNEPNANLTNLSNHNSALQQHLTTVLTSVQQKDVSKALTTINSDYKTASEAMYTLLEKIVFEKQIVLDQLATMTKSKSASSMIISASASLCIVLLVTTFLVYIQRGITVPLHRIAKEVNTIANGDLTGEPLSIRSRDEIGELSLSFNQLKQNFQTIVDKIHTSSAHLQSSSQDLTGNSAIIMDISTRIAQRLEESVTVTENNALAAQESSAAMHETTVSIQQIAEATQILHGESVHLSVTSTNGMATIQQAIEQMDTIYTATSLINELTEKLSKQSDEISHFSKIITDITDQTNLLALNATIEAARAGESGKGFAVVADEVRKLAEQSKLSAEQIGQLTTSIQQDTTDVTTAVQKGLSSVKDGVAIIHEAGHSFTTISSSIGHLTNQVEHISATSKQISTSAEQVSVSVNKIADNAEHAVLLIDTISDESVQQAAQRQHINDVIEVLNSNTLELRQLIKNFKI
ncbi:MAG: methyl-accepting chemotaxis protein [Solibacillus sp.]